jgi:hypothetical protein
MEDINLAVMEEAENMIQPRRWPRQPLFRCGGSHLSRLALRQCLPKFVGPVTCAGQGEC